MRNKLVKTAFLIGGLSLIITTSTFGETKQTLVEDDWWAIQKVRTDWVYATLKQSEIGPILDRALKEQERWSRRSENAPNAFKCKKLSLPSPSAAALAAFDSATTARGSKADKAYALSASLGYWRAAGRLASRSLQDEYWEGVVPIAAWMLAHHVPAGYNKLADVIQAKYGYDGEPLTDGRLDQVTGLRWRAAREGDPLAQVQMADLFDKLDKREMAASLRKCAEEQNPDLSR